MTYPQATVTSVDQPPQLAVTAEPQQQPIGAFAASAGQAVRIVSAGRDETGVILARDATTGNVRVLIDGLVQTLREDVVVEPVTDPATVAALARQATVWAVAAKDEATKRIWQLEDDLGEQRRLQAQRLNEIRGYAINRFRDNDFSRDELNGFLDDLNLNPFDPRHRVRFTISGSLDVDSDGRDTEYTSSDVRNYLKLDLERVDGVNDDSVTFDVTVEDVEDLGE
ncbi:hypothetical protein Ais01nite_73870 [Asanoa ishikariensis]|uniref:Uncharacterized protein n=1 Tax=Asanoa ishikariensis TaxID=137265 RepID=A0A1H3URH9_9ACTN|nr:hypothetical protein [Asanoa ishikariensis]GIF69352.1 hypothetical protein Ais01nite_73870 [Asanoa ishikariensis]SDZ65043.1 hypothetical protein SAMN05421684_7911 [Asanoa ishikariensis]